MRRGRDFSTRSMLLAMPITMMGLELEYGHSKRSYTMLRSLVSNLSISSIQRMLCVRIINIHAQRRLLA